MTVRGYTSTRFGQIHWVEAAAPDPAAPVVLCLHQTPRSVDEYAELLPALAATGLRGIAVDTIGFGASPPLAQHSIETYADGVIAFLDAAGLREVTLLGHHTGGVVAVEVAARRPAAVARLVLSSTPHTGPQFRERRRGSRGIDEVETREDGSHLAELWRRRAAFYPTGRPDILTRFVRDALVVGEHLEAGHRAVGAYVMEERLPEIDVPVLLVGADADPYAFPHLAELSELLPTASVHVVAGGMVALMEVHADEVAAAVVAFVPR